MHIGNWQEEYAYTWIELQIKPVYNNVQNNKTLGPGAESNCNIGIGIHEHEPCIAILPMLRCRDKFGNANIFLTSDSAPLDKLNAEYPLCCKDKNVS